MPCGAVKKLKKKKKKERKRKRKKGLITGRAGFRNQDLEGNGRCAASDMGSWAKEEHETKDPHGRGQQSGLRQTWGPILAPLGKGILGICLKLCEPFYPNCKMEIRSPPLSSFLPQRSVISYIRHLISYMRHLVQ